MEPKTKAQYTKGEWRIGRAVGTGTIAITSDGGIPLAYVAGRDVEAQANAVLMASAKDLLQALQKWQAFMVENYTHEDLSWFTETSNAIDRATGKFIPPNWRAALPDLALDAARANIDSAVRRHLYKPSSAFSTSVNYGRCLAPVHDRYGVGFHQCVRKPARNLFGAELCTQHYMKIRASMAADRARKA